MKTQTLPHTAEVELVAPNDDKGDEVENDGEDVCLTSEETISNKKKTKQQPGNTATRVAESVLGGSDHG